MVDILKSKVIEPDPGKSPHFFEQQGKHLIHYRSSIVTRDTPEESSVLLKARSYSFASGIGSESLKY